MKISRVRVGRFLAAATAALALSGCTGNPHREWYIAAGAFEATTNAISDAAEAGVISGETIRDEILPPAERGKAALDAAYLLLPAEEGDPIPNDDGTFERKIQTVRSVIHIIRAAIVAGGADR